MSDSESIKTDRSQSDLQQKYDRLAMEFAKVRMQLNILKKAYTTNISKIEQFDNCKYDTLVSTNNLDNQDLNNPNQVNVTKLLKSSDIQLLKQEINTMHLHIHRVLESTKSNKFDYNLIMSEIEYCNDIQNSYTNKCCETLSSEFESLKLSVSACLFKILYNKLESRSKIITDDSRLNDYFNHYCLDDGYKTNDNKFKTVFVCIIIKLFLSIIVNVHSVLEYLFIEINPNCLQILENSFKSLNSQLHNTLILDKILIYSEDLKKLKFDSQYIILENILLFISKKYIEFVDCVKHVMKSNDITENIASSSLRQIIISFMCLNFPIGELMISNEYWDTGNINIKLTDVYNTVHILLRAINILEFEYLYKNSQSGIHWHMTNTFLHVKHSRQTIEELNSHDNYENTIHIYDEKLNKELKRSLSLEQEKINWENRYNLLLKHLNNQDNTAGYSESSGTFFVENQVGKCESNLNFIDEVKSRERGLKSYFEKKMNDLIFRNTEMSSQNNACLIEITALKTQLEHSIFIRNELEIKLHEALEHIDDLKEEFQLTTTNYDTQLRAMTEHLASLNETVVFERRHIESLNSQLKTKSDKKKK